MQTFLPYPNFAESARVLDRSRLGKQRLEAIEILTIITGAIPHGLTKTGRNVAEPSLIDGQRYKHHRNHPAVLMWTGYPDALAAYYMAVVREWQIRGYQHNMGFLRVPSRYGLPPWIGHQRFHISHQSRLVQKNPTHYRPVFPEAPDDLDYFWPTKEDYWRNMTAS
jgi:hypothetical protein